MKRLAWALSFSVGFLSLSQEVVWFRVVGFAFESLPQAFSFVLGAFLAGVAVGAILGKQLCRPAANMPVIVGTTLFIAGLLDLALIALVPASFGGSFSVVAIAALIAFTAAAKAAVFPMVHHMGSEPGKHIGRSVSRVYFFNILGSTLAPLLTGLLLLEHFSVGAMILIIAAGTLGLAAATLAAAALRDKQGFRQYLAPSAIAMICCALVLNIDSKDSSLVKSIVGKDVGDVSHVIENRHGIIHVVAGEGDDDIVFGGNVYDGRTNVDLARNTNRIDRAYLLHALHPSPRQVLVIGLSTGAWTRVLTYGTKIEQIDVIEINPGYLDLIKGYESLAPLLNDPRLTLYVDDGRRWLRRNQGKRYDLVVMNVTLHWRSNATNLLSVEMLHLVREHMKSGAILAFNATGSDDAFLTASRVFPYAFRFRNFVYASDHDFRPELRLLELRLKALEDQGQPIFDMDSEGHRAAINQLKDLNFVSIEDAQTNSPRPLQIVTDRNMITEFRYGRRLF